VIAVAFSSTGKYLATGGMDGSVKIWESETGNLTVSLDGPDEVIVRSSPSFSRFSLSVYTHTLALHLCM
jgi:WD40 repeat protein